VIREISDIKQQFTQHPGVRPFGVSIIIAGVFGKEGKLYTSDITGNYFEYYAIAIGENDDKLKEILRKKFKKDMKIEDGIKLCIDSFKEVLQNKFDITRFNVSYVKKEDEQLKKSKPEEIKKYN
jgi:proteasome alpha subunit